MTSLKDQFLEQAQYQPLVGQRWDGVFVSVDDVWNALNAASSFDEMFEILIPDSAERADRLDVDFGGDGSWWWDDRRERFVIAA